MNRALNHFKSNVIAYLALFVALGGTSYAATTLGPGSVGTRQLKNHSVSPVKLQKSSIGGYVRDWAQVNEGGHLIASRPHARLVNWTESGLFPGGIVSWGHSIPRSCFALATTSPASASVAFASAAITNRGSQIVLSAPETAVNVAVVCPQP
ncbi:MAG TPA: hypothetical protein VN880_13710 [Solirubrobacteraceae bacterium]|nr:hypothetical protein [Solirubrobacteraceae bacterium]